MPELLKPGTKVRIIDEALELYLTNLKDRDCFVINDYGDGTVLVSTELPPSIYGDGIDSVFPAIKETLEVC